MTDVLSLRILQQWRDYHLVDIPFVPWLVLIRCPVVLVRRRDSRYCRASWRTLRLDWLFAPRIEACVPELRRHPWTEVALYACLYVSVTCWMEVYLFSG